MHKLTELILTTSTTKKQAKRRMAMLRGFINFLLFTGNADLPINEAMKEYSKSVSRDNQISWISSLDASLLQDMAPDNAPAFFADLEAGIDQVKTVVLYVPTDIDEDPTQALTPVGSNQPSAQEQQLAIDSLGAWFKKNLGPQTLFEIKYDSELIGGCALSYKGTYKDYSLKVRIDENKTEILKNLISLHTQRRG